MTPALRRLALTAHITSSVGWLGAVGCSLALAIAGLVGDDVRTAYGALALIGWTVLVPLSIASLLTGLIQSLGTSWGLIRHYWVLVKLALNLFATGVLLLYTRTLDQLASAPRADPSPVLHSGIALALLIGAAALSVYKPKGLTPYGERRRQPATGARPGVPAARRRA